jgi:hypothetical protein
MLRDWTAGIVIIIIIIIIQIQGAFPSSCKEAEVVPLTKNGSNALVINHRPISVLNNFWELSESAVRD